MLALNVAAACGKGNVGFVPTTVALDVLIVRSVTAQALAAVAGVKTANPVLRATTTVTVGCGLPPVVFAVTTAAQDA